MSPKTIILAAAAAFASASVPTAAFPEAGAWTCESHERPKTEIRLASYTNSTGLIESDGTRLKAAYHAQGLVRRWAIGGTEGGHAFIIKPDNQGIYVIASEPDASIETALADSRAKTVTIARFSCIRKF
ncbi:MAG: hypothetical protein F4103_19205 [Boseongicola sp. SB0673_bin_14]|nr:hypothetical protein [Boseongicola sp. SB0673_bin_14]